MVSKLKKNLLIQKNIKKLLLHESCIISAIAEIQQGICSEISNLYLVISGVSEVVKFWKHYEYGVSDTFT